MPNLFFSLYLSVVKLRLFTTSTFIIQKCFFNCRQRIYALRENLHSTRCKRKKQNSPEMPKPTVNYHHYLSECSSSLFCGYIKRIVYKWVSATDYFGNLKEFHLKKATVAHRLITPPPAGVRTIVPMVHGTGSMDAPGGTDSVTQKENSSANVPEPYAYKHVR